MALATVVRVEGSSYRRMGARLLMSENGRWVGGISGGCLEGDALKRAKLAIIKATASVITYDTTTDDDHQIGVGLGCNGIIDVLFKPIDDTQANALTVLQNAINGPRKTRKFIGISKCSDTSLLGEIIDFEEKDAFQKLAKFTDLEMLAPIIDSLEKSKNLIIDENLTLFVEVLPPTLHLVLMGHQYDLYPLVRQIKELGWDCTIVAPPSKVNLKTDETLSIVGPDEFNTNILDTYTALILMSHSLNTDKENLRKLINSGCQYIGMLGPKVRSERILNELKNEGETINDSFLSTIYAPTGLDIGATNPEEISMSILAEIKAVFAHRNAANLRQRSTPIHDREQPMKFE